MRYIIPITVGVLYVAQGVYHLSKKEWGFACMWLAYGVANAGVCLAMADGKDH